MSLQLKFSDFYARVDSSIFFISTISIARILTAVTFYETFLDISASRVSPESKSQFQNAKFSIPFIQQNFWYLLLHLFLNKCENHCILLPGIFSFKNSEPTRTTFKTSRFDLLYLIKVEKHCTLFSTESDHQKETKVLQNYCWQKKWPNFSHFLCLQA